jgi:hypothetical protein
MSTKGIPKPNSTELIHLACGHVVPYAPPVPGLHDELTCRICGEPTEVAA